MMLYGQELYDADGGSVSVNLCSSRDEAVRKVVDLARMCKIHPPAWWQFWRTPWPKDCLEAWRAEP